MDTFTNPGCNRGRIKGRASAELVTDSKRKYTKRRWFRRTRIRCIESRADRESDETNSRNSKTIIKTGLHQGCLEEHVVVWPDKTIGNNAYIVSFIQNPKIRTKRSSEAQLATACAVCLRGRRVRVLCRSRARGHFESAEKLAAHDPKSPGPKRKSRPTDSRTFYANPTSYTMSISSQKSKAVSILRRFYATIRGRTSRVSVA